MVLDEVLKFCSENSWALPFGLAAYTAGVFYVGKNSRRDVAIKGNDEKHSLKYYARKHMAGSRSQHFYDTD
jgi:hypothetical protein